MNSEAKTIEKKRLTAIRAVEAAVILGIGILLACLFDYRYAMNDDVLISSIISGRYSGVPDAHNIQMIMPLNVVFTVLYRINAAVPWFGCFMVVSQFFSLYVIIRCLAGKINSDGAYRYACLIAVSILLAGIMINELVIIQYTYTAALLITSATIRLYCMEETDLRSGKCVLRYLGILVHYLAAFCLRTEIFLFLLPFSLLLTIIHYYRKNKFKPVKADLGGWAAFWGILFACVLALYAVDNAGYSNQGWREYRQVFSYRTQLYDFLELPPYEVNREFYESAGITEGQYKLLENYNFSLDDGITSETLRKVVDYADGMRISEYRGFKRFYYQMFTLPLNEAVWSYSHRVLFDPRVAGDDYPWNFVCAALYLALFLLTCLSRRVQNIVYMILMFSMRSALWMYIILKQRTPPRVTHSLFVIEIVCLLVLIFEEMSFLKESRRLKRPELLYTGLSALFLAGAGAVAVSSWGSFPSVYEDTVAYNQEWEELLEYCGEHKDNFYFMDVYSTVNYSEAIFADNSSEMDNYDICGGWLAKSPLCGEKYEQFGISSVSAGLIENENVFFVAEQGSNLDWLKEVYAEQGIDLEIEQQDSVAGQFAIYKLRGK